MVARVLAHKVRTRVWTITCPKCGIEMYSRAHYDYRVCKCGTMVDGGFSGYVRYGWPNGEDRPSPRIRYIAATKAELYDDWNRGINKFGIIARKG
jgi:hypothetical protein